MHHMSMCAMSKSQALDSKPKSWDAGQINFSSDIGDGGNNSYTTSEDRMRTK